jgi:hypothetical protein
VGTAALVSMISFIPLLTGQLKTCGPGPACTVGVGTPPQLQLSSAHQ